MIRGSAAVIPLVVLACARGTTAVSPSVAVPAAATATTPDELRRDLFVFASDSFRGRESGTPGEMRATRFLVDRLQALGVEPAGDSGYIQRFPLERRSLGATSRFAVTTPRGAEAIEPGEALVPLGSLGPGAPPPRLSVDADIVFLGYGLAEGGRDDFAGLDLRGRTVVVVNAAPPGTDSARREALESQQAFVQRVGRIVQQGPAAVIVLLTGKFGEDFRTAVPSLLESVSRPSAGPEVPDSARVMPMVLLGLARPGSPLLPAGWPANDSARVLAGRRFTARVQYETAPVTATNVVAVVRGSDPRLNQTYVAFGAHLDHIGIEPPTAGDSIANGADDDGSGSVALLALARRLMGGARPARSVLLVWHGAEEKGLLGSAHFVEHPTVPLDSIVAQLNADMIGRNHPDSLYIVGPMAAPNNQSRILGAIVDSVNAARPRPFSFNREWDSPNHPEQIYFRSDHYNYARRGIPVVFFTTGLHDDYHKVSDEPDKIEYEKLARISDLLFEIGVALGNRPTRPR